MKFLLPLLASLPCIIASPAVITTEAAILLVEKHLSTSETELKVLKPGTKEVLGHSCSTLLTTGSFKNYQITLGDLDKQGGGRILIGGKTYVVSSDPNVSGGIICGRSFSPDGFQLDCEIQVPATIAPLATASNCFAKRSLEPESPWSGIYDLELDDSEEVNNSTYPEQLAERHEKRQCSISDGTRRVGNGTPWQGYYHKQISDKFNCAKAGCEIGLDQTTSYTISASATASWNDWISGSFSVEKTVSTGQTKMCSLLQGTGDNLCVMKKIAHTSYIVRNYDKVQCPPGPAITEDKGDNFRIRSPNKNNQGGGFWCRVGPKCQYNGYGGWAKDKARPGLP